MLIFQFQCSAHVQNRTLLSACETFLNWMFLTPVGYNHQLKRPSQTNLNLKKIVLHILLTYEIFVCLYLTGREKVWSLWCSLFSQRHSSSRTSDAHAGPHLLNALIAYMCTMWTTIQLFTPVQKLQVSFVKHIFRNSFDSHNSRTWICLSTQMLFVKFALHQTHPCSFGCTYHHPTSVRN